jgi:hypothetical protein
LSGHSEYAEVRFDLQAAAMGGSEQVWLTFENWHYNDVV